MKTQWKATGIVKRIASRPDHRWIRFTRGGGTGTMPVSFPKIRAPVRICTIAKTAAAEANQALNAIGVEKTLVTRSVYADSTLAASKVRRPYYDQRMSRRAVRLILVPAVLFVVVSATVFTLAQLHLAKDEAQPSAAATGVAATPDERGH